MGRIRRLPADDTNGAIRANEAREAAAVARGKNIPIDVSSGSISVTRTYANISVTVCISNSSRSCIIYDVYSLSRLCNSYGTLIRRIKRPSSPEIRSRCWLSRHEQQLVG